MVFAVTSLFHRNTWRDVRQICNGACRSQESWNTGELHLFHQAIPGEGRREFLTRFKRVRMTLPNVSKRMVVEAFQNGMSREGSRVTRKLLIWLMNYPLATWEINNAYYAEVRVDNEDLNRPTRWLTSVQFKPKNNVGKIWEETIHYHGQVENNISPMPRHISLPSSMKTIPLVRD